MVAGAELAVDHGGASIARRYVFGPGIDEPLVWYEGAGTSDRRYLHADERGSIVAVSDGAGAALAINAYDDYGIPSANNLGRFQYTGQAWVPELGMYYYKARMYSPTLGRFLQPDPIGYGDGLNWYDYVGGDPVNFVDPFGLQSGGNDIVVQGPSCGVGQVLTVSNPGQDDQHYSCITSGRQFQLRALSDGNGGGGLRGRFTVEPYPPQKAPTCANAGVAGKLTNALGAGWALAAWAAGKLAGTNPTMTASSMGVRVTNSPINGGNRAVSLGNFQIFTPVQTPSSTINPSYDGSAVNAGRHENGYTVQAAALGDLYIPIAIASTIADSLGYGSSLELGADAYAHKARCD